MDVLVPPPALLPRVDPYSQWAIRTNFEYLSKASHFGYESYVPVIVEAKGSLRELRIWLVDNDFAKDFLLTPLFFGLVGAEKRKICTARMSRALFFAVNTNSDHTLWKSIERLELAMHVSPEKVSLDPQPEPTIGGFLEGRSTVIGVIDIGCAYANGNWRHRVAALWNQGGETGGETPSDAGYGRQWIRKAGTAGGFQPIAPIAHIADVSDESESYRRFGFEHVDRYRTHGAAVIGELTQSVRPYHAHEAPLVIVELPQHVTAYSARAALSAHVLDGLAWILMRGKKTKSDTNTRFVVNVSLGTQAGPHDGSSMLESFFDELIAAYTIDGSERLAIVLAAGNSYESRCHARVALKAKTPKTIRFLVPPDDVTPSYVELWFGNTADCTVTLTMPDGREIAATIGNENHLNSENGKTAASIVFCRLSAGGEGIMALIAIAPTANGTAEHGAYGITLNAAADVEDVELYVERDNAMFDPARPRGRQSSFLHPIERARYSTIDSSQPTYIYADGTLNSLATARRSVAVGSYVHIGSAPSRYSSAGPARYSAPTKPDVAAVGDDAFGLSGMLVSATYSNVQTRLGGTSLSAPSVTAMIAGAMQYGKINSSTTVRQWLLSQISSPAAKKKSVVPVDVAPQIGNGRIARHGITNNGHAHRG
jgi:hypothetical protein